MQGFGYPLGQNRRQRNGRWPEANRPVIDLRRSRDPPRACPVHAPAGLRLLLFRDLLLTFEHRGQPVADPRQPRDQAEAPAAAAAAETAKARADAQKLALDARAKAKAAAAAREAVEEAKLAETLAKAEARITGVRDEAMTHVGSIAQDTALALVSKLTGTAVSPDEILAAMAQRS